MCATPILNNLSCSESKTTLKHQKQTSRKYLFWASTDFQSSINALIVCQYMRDYAEHVENKYLVHLLFSFYQIHSSNSGKMWKVEFKSHNWSAVQSLHVYKYAAYKKKSDFTILHPHAMYHAVCCKNDEQEWWKQGHVYQFHIYYAWRRIKEATIVYFSI